MLIDDNYVIPAGQCIIPTPSPPTWGRDVGPGGGGCLAAFTPVTGLSGWEISVRRSKFLDIWYRSMVVYIKEMHRRD